MLTAREPALPPTAADTADRPVQARDWWRSSVMYQIYPRSFADSAAGIRSRLDYVVELGIDALRLDPFDVGPIADGGYEITDRTEPVVLDLLDSAAVRKAVVEARPDAIVNQTTALATVLLQELDRSFGQTNQLRRDALLAPRASRASAGASPSAIGGGD